MSGSRRSAILGLVVVAALVAATTASAKGPQSATISGPGLAHAIALGGGGEPGSAGTLGRTAQYAGFFDSVYWSRLDGLRMLTKERPNGRLGPRYVLTYRVRGLHGLLRRFRQDVYPYAAGGAVSFTPPAQKPLGGREKAARSGWYPGGANLKRALVEAGLPKAAPV